MKKIFVLFMLSLIINNADAKIFIHEGHNYVEKEWAKDSVPSNVFEEHLGYLSSQYFWYKDFDNESTSIISTYHKLGTAEILFVETEDDVMSLTESEVNDYILNFDYNKRITAFDYARIIDEACNNKNFTLRFMTEILSMKYIENCKDTMLIDKKNKYKYIFENGILVNAIPTDGLKAWARSYQDCDYFKIMKEYAKSYWKNNNDKIIWELNTQCDAWAKIPSGFTNKFCYLFAEYETKICNAKIMNVALYGDTNINEQELKDITHNKVRFDGEKTYFGKYCKRYSYKGYYFLFDRNGKFYKVMEIE